MQAARVLRGLSGGVGLKERTGEFDPLAPEAHRDRSEQPPVSCDLRNGREAIADLGGMGRGLFPPVRCCLQLGDPLLNLCPDGAGLWGGIPGGLDLAADSDMPIKAPLGSLRGQGVGNLVASDPSWDRTWWKTITWEDLHCSTTARVSRTRSVFELGSLVPFRNLRAYSLSTNRWMGTEDPHRWPVGGL
jgi:hypothetical protein